MKELDKKISIGIPTLLRDNCLGRLVSSITNSPFSGPVIVADQNERSEIDWIGDEVQVLNLKFDVGASRARNAILDQLQTDFILFLDDDIIFDYKVLETLWDDFRNRPDFGWISPAIKDLDENEISSHAGDWEILGQKLVREFLPVDGDFHQVDQPSLVGLYRAEMWDEVRFPPKVKTGGEHIIMAWHFQDTKWKAGVDTSIHLEHGNCKAEAMYRSFRKRKARAREVFHQETGLVRIEHRQ